MESKIIELRERSRTQVRRLSRTLVIAVGVGAAVGVAVVGALIVYRVTRPPTARERVERVIPRGVMKDLRRARQTLELGLRRQVPPMRLYVGDKQLGEEKPSSQWERIAVNVARAAATAAASAVVARLVDQIKPGKASAEKAS
ncbi:MAG: hypothetical protein M3075_07090 [Candidatus Dormibacteraeota bacterium]|nr:hypothetical protein [Candidatus Dormibacteraeota bacterium]